MKPACCETTSRLAAAQANAMRCTGNIRENPVRAGLLCWAQVAAEPKVPMYTRLLKPSSVDAALACKHAHPSRCRMFVCSSATPRQQVAQLVQDQDAVQQLGSQVQEQVADVVDVDRTGELLIWLWQTAFGRSKGRQSQQVKLAEQQSGATQHTEASTTGAIAVFGCGCFWCLEPAFKSIKGVMNVTSGYTGGSQPAPSYQQVCAGNSGHAEVVKVEYNTSEISYEQLLGIFTAIMEQMRDQHQPQGVQVEQGSQYRPIILAMDCKQVELANKVLQLRGLQHEVQVLQAAGDATHGAHLDSHSSAETTFWQAEDEHQAFASCNPASSYTIRRIQPLLARLKHELGDSGLWRPAEA